MKDFLRATRIVFVAIAIVLAAAIAWTSYDTNVSRIDSVGKIFLSSGGWGSAIHIGNDRWLTAKHVVERYKIKSLRTLDVYYFGTEIEWMCDTCDLAIVKTPHQSFKEIPTITYECREPIIGEVVSYSGSPISHTQMPHLTFYGRVASDRYWNNYNNGPLFPVNIYTRPGGSGSGILDEDGILFGLVTQMETMFNPFAENIPMPIVWVSPLTEFCKYEKSRISDKPPVQAPT